MKIITVVFTAKPEARDKVIEVCTAMIAPSRNEEGCLSYNFYENMNERDSFFFYEEWKDQEAIEYHTHTKHYKNFLAQFESLIIGTADMKIRSLQ